MAKVGISLNHDTSYWCNIRYTTHWGLLRFALELATVVFPGMWYVPRPRVQALVLLGKDWRMSQVDQTSEGLVAK